MIPTPDLSAVPAELTVADADILLGASDKASDLGSRTRGLRRIESTIQRSGGLDRPLPLFPPVLKRHELLRRSRTEAITTLNSVRAKAIPTPLKTIPSQPLT